MSFDGYFYDNDFPNMSDVTELQCRRAGSDLTVDLSSPIYFIPRWYERGSVNQAGCGVDIWGTGKRKYGPNGH